MNAPAPLPHSLETEQAVLGALLLDNGIYWEVAARIGAGDFHEALHAELFQAIAKEIGEGRQARPASIAKLAECPALTEVGGQDYLRRIAEEAVAVVFPLAYAEELRETAVKRALVRGLEGAALAARQPHTGSGEALAGAWRALEAATELGARQDEGKRVAVCADEALREAEAASATQGMPGVPLGIPSLDRMTGGMRPGEFWVVAGRPGMGKSMVLGHAALAAARAGHGVLLVSLEMMGSAIAFRFLSSLAYEVGERVAYSDAYAGRLTAPEEQALRAARVRLDGLPMTIIDRRALTVAEIKMAAQRARLSLARAGKRLGLVAIDYLGLIRPESGRQKRYEEVTDISARLMALPGDLGVPVLCAAQLNRENEKRNDHRPTLADLRDSGAIEQDAHAVLLLHREAYYLERNRPSSSDGVAKTAEWEDSYARCRNDLEIIIAKRRMGRTGKLLVHCDAATSFIGDRA